jgi:amidase
MGRMSRTETTDDQVGAFCPGPRTRLPALADGPLRGTSFGVKDLYDLAGEVTGGGNPDWARTHPPAAAHAVAVQLLLEAGASVAGRTKTVELAYGLTGENVWQGTPINPAAPDRFPGGSSCGSAAATAAGLCDFALGSDTGGSVRIPASYCGLFGIRPSWGAVNAVGCMVLAPSFDTVGWFARDAALLARVGQVLLAPASLGQLGPLLKVDDAWANADAETASALAPALATLEAHMGRACALQLAPEGLVAFQHGFVGASLPEAWTSHGGWIESVQPKFGPGVGERFQAARSLPTARILAGRATRATARARLAGLLGGGAVLVFPTSPGPAPKLTASREEQQRVRERTLNVTAIAGLAGLPEVTLPVAKVANAEGGGAPVGLSLVAAAGQDQALLALAAKAAAWLGLPHGA